MRRIILFFLFTYFQHSLFCQNDGDIETVEIKIVKDYNVFIEEASKLNIPIQYNPLFKDKTSQKKIQYKLPDRIEQFKFEPSSIEPIAFKSKEFFYGNTNFLRLGAGSALNPIVEWSHAKINAKNPYKIYLLHHSAWMNSDAYQKYSETRGEVEYNTILKDWKLTPKLALNHKLYNFYGNINESLDKNDAQRNYGNIDFNLKIDREKSEIKSLSVKNQINLNFGLDNLNYLNGKKTNSEFLSSLTSTLSYQYSENARINLTGGAQYYSFKYDTFTDKWLINLMPTVEYKTKALKVSGGLDFVQTLINSKSIFYVFPKLETEVQLIPNFVNFYSLWERKIEMNQLRNTLNNNTFALFTNYLLPNTKVENRSAGIRGSIKDISYHAYINQKILKEALLFKNDDQNPRFNVAEIEKNMTQNNISIELSYLKAKKWSTYLKGDLFLYELDNLPVAYNLPSQRLSMGMNVVASKKLNLSLNTFIIGGVKTYIAGNQVNNPMAFDLNLGGEFHISKNFYIFANLNNMLNTRISPQFGYQTIGFNGQGGFRIIY